MAQNIRAARGGVRSNDQGATSKTAMSGSAIATWANTKHNAIAVTVWAGKNGEPDQVAIDYKPEMCSSDLDSGFVQVFRGTFEELIEKLSK